MTIDPIAHILTPYPEKFAVPRQPGLVPAATGELVFTPPYADANALRGIEQFSHLWLIFSFHHNRAKGWSPLVRPPRLGGNTKVGVFATRASFRPNALGMSKVTNLGWQQQGKKLTLTVGGVDLVNQTPIFDIKPYLPYSDSEPDATAGFANASPKSALRVDFTDSCQQVLQSQDAIDCQLSELIMQVLSQDPRPAYQRQDSTRQYGIRLYHWNIRWQVAQGHCLVTDITEV